jgi:phosphonate transport system substrate-binding protein
MINKLAISLSAVMALSTAYAQDINLGIISTESTTNLKADWQPLIDDMSTKTGYNIKAFFASDYAGVIEAMRFNKVQVAWFGNKSAMEAVDRAKGEIFAQMVNADGTEGYYSHMIVHKDSPVNNLDDLLKMSENLTFSNGDPNSTSGFLVPSYYVFSKNKVDPKTMFKAVRGANHEANALAVANKQIDVATNNSETLGRIKDRMPEKASNIKVIWTSPLIPSDPMVIRSDLDPAVKAKIKDFFYSYGSNDTEKATLMQLQKITGFKVSSNDQLKPIRQLELFKARNKLEADTTMGAADKTAKLADIDKQLAVLN